MGTTRATTRVAQAWIELISADPEAVSALGVAQDQLPAARHLKGLRRVRLVELRGRMPPRERIEALLHGSTQFYNPHKERCTVRLGDRDPAPIEASEQAVLVFERGGSRLAAAERWWRHETGDAIEAREGTIWILSFEGGSPHEREIEDLALVRGRRHGLLCNPHSQECRVAGGHVPLPWLDGESTRKATTARRRTSNARSKS